METKSVKVYYMQYNVGRAKYVLNHWNGIKQHNDGSPSYDIILFSNKKVFKKVLSDFKKAGYVEKSA